MQFNATPSVGGSKNYLKLKDGEQVVGVFRGNPHEFYVLWKEGKAEPVPEGTKGASFRFRINFITKENEMFVAKIFEQGATVYNQLKELHEEHGLSETVVVIRRSGTEKKTTYNIMPSGKTKWSPALAKQVEAIELHKLNESSNEENIFGGGDHPDDEIPF
jgi:hypothetical protein